MKILVVGRKFGSVAGGVERMAIMLMHAMHARGHEVELLTWDNADASTHYPLGDQIRWHKIDLGDPMRRSNWLLRLRRLRRMRKIICSARPDVVVAFQHGPFLAVWVALAGTRIPIVAAERNAPQRFDHLRAGRYRSAIYASFLLAQRVTVQMDTYRSVYPAYLRDRIVAIPNPVWPVSRPGSPAGADGASKILLFVGRLSYQKNPEALLRAFAKLGRRFPDWRLDLVGDGEDREKLEALAVKLKIADNIRFLGATRDVEGEYARAQLFCLPSRWEGFPNALAEAFMHGLPAVGFGECAGVNELIRPNVNGLLAAGNGNVETLAAALAELMADTDRRCAMGQSARPLILEYSPEKIFDRWEKLFSEVSTRGAS